MKFIAKGDEPRALRDWRLRNKLTPQARTYASMPTEVRAELRNVLLREQGYLCGYTMMRIGRAASGHIEHIQAQSRAEDRDVDYRNMIYCHPGNGQLRCDFGAHCKGDGVVSGENFVSPLERSCESRFRYELSGRVRSANEADSAAKTTIEILNLNDSELEKLRAAAIRTLPFFRNEGKRATASEARKIGSDIIKADGTGRFRPFLVAIRQVAERYLRQREAFEAGVKRSPSP